MTTRPRIAKIDIAGVALRLEVVREITGLNRDMFARSFGLDPSSYTKIASTTKPLKAEYAFAISEQWGVSMDFIYRGDLSKMPDDMRAKVMAALNKAD
jgi:hypothetical protein